MTSRSGVDPWLRIFDAQDFVGVGFLITRRYALTAAHVLGKRANGHRLTAHFVGGNVRARLVGTSGDLALLEVDDFIDHGLMPAQAGRAVERTRWSGPARPWLTSAVLTGTIDAADLTYELESGDVVSVHQLGVEQDLGSHHGYSGGPVLAERERLQQVVGVILEQLPDSIEEDRSSNVLFAIAIEQAFGAFAELTGFDPSDSGTGLDDNEAERFAHDTLLDKHEAILRRAKRWADEGLIEAVDYEVYKIRVQREIFESLERGDEQ